MRPGRHPDRGHLRPRQPEGGRPTSRATSAPTPARVRRSSRLNTPSFKGDVLIYQNEICAGLGAERHRRRDARRRHQPAQAQEAGRGLRRLHQQGQEPDPLQPGALGVRLDQRRDRPGLRDHDRRRGGHRHRHHRHHQPEQADVGRRVRLRGRSPRSRSGAVHGDAVFIHDEVVKKIDGRYIGLLSYWDGGYIQVDLTDPANAVFLGDTDYPAVDPVLLARDRHRALARGQRPRGRVHARQRVLRRHRRGLRPVPHRRRRSPTGRSPATTLTAIQGSDVPQIDNDTSLTGDTRFVGLACDAASHPAGRRRPPDRRHRAGRLRLHRQGPDRRRRPATRAPIVFNRTGVDGCETLITMLADGRHPGRVRLPHRRLPHPRARRSPATPARTTAPARPAPAVGRGRLRPSTSSAVFDGWGYIHLFDADDDGRPRPVRHPRGPRPGLRRRLRRPVGARGGDRPRRRPGLRLVLLGRLPGAELRRRRPQEVGRSSPAPA